MSKDDTLVALNKIEERLQEIVQILRVQNQEILEASKRRVLSSPIRKGIYDLCDGKRSVGEISKILGKKIQQVSNNIPILLNAGLIREVEKSGKEKFYATVN